MMSREREPDEALEAHPSLTPRFISLALAYYDEHPEEIDRILEENSRPPEHWQKLYPGLGIKVHNVEESGAG